MNKIACILILLAALQVITSSGISPQELLANYMNGPKKELFKAYHLVFNKGEHYPLDSFEGVRRYKIFKENLRWIDAENSKNTGVTYGIGPFTDMTTEEFKSKYLVDPEILAEQVREKTRNSLKFMGTDSNNVIPNMVKLNWQKYFNPARNQGWCGSCWAFATAGAIEGNYKLQFNESFTLSTQELVDCDTTDYGCNGGNPSFAMNYVKQMGLCLDKDYPYTSGNTNTKYTCQASTCTAKKVLESYTVCGGGNCDIGTWMSMLQKGPMEIVIYADALQHYTSGVMATDTCGQADHAVVAVGLDSDANGDYVIIRNSWGATWGENGYFRFRYNLSTHTCHATEFGWLPKVQKDNNNPTPPPTPTVTCPVFYKDCPYAGTTVESCDTIQDLSTKNFADVMSSIKMNSAKKVQIFSETNCTGKNVILTADEQCLAWDNNYMFNDRSYSIAVSMEEPKEGCIWAFTECCYSGGKQEFCSDVADLTTFKFSNTISSIQFGPNVTGVTLYLNTNFQGLAWGITSDFGCLNQIESKFFYDSTSSLRITSSSTG